MCHVARREEQRDWSLFGPLPELGREFRLLVQLGLVAAPKFFPLGGIVAEPLAQFGARRKKDETLAQSMEEWNERYPTWRYRTVTNFGRDVKKAQQRLMQPGL